MAFLEDLRSLVEGLQDPGQPQAPAPKTAVPTPSMAPDPRVVLSQPAPVDATPPHHSGLQNILGHIADAFLVQGGGKPEVQMRRDQERAGAALQHLRDDPMLAVTEYAKTNPELAAKLYETITRNSAYSDNIQANNDTKTMGLIGSLLRTATPQNWDGIRSTIGRISSSRKYQLPFELPTMFDQDFVDSNKYFGSQPSAVYTDERRGESIGERRDYHGQMEGVAEDRNNIYRTDVNGRLEHYRRVDDQGDQRVAQGEARVKNDTRRTDSTISHRNTTERQGDRRLDQGDRALQQFDDGVRGNTRRPSPKTLRHRILPSGEVKVQRLVNGKWTDI